MTVGFNVLVEIDGAQYPLEKCEWVWFLRCGCPVACSHATTAEEETAWKGMFYYAKERARHRKNGVTAELMPFARAREEVIPKMSMGYKCPHV